MVSGCSTSSYPIVLSDGMARLLNSCHTSDMVSMCETHKVLPPNHYGARPGRTTTDSVHALTKTVKDAWRKGKVASSLFLDVKAAFPSVDINRLIHNMRKRGIPEEYTIWMRKRLENRRTTLRFDDFETQPFAVKTDSTKATRFQESATYYTIPTWPTSHARRMASTSYYLWTTQPSRLLVKTLRKPMTNYRTS